MKVYELNIRFKNQEECDTWEESHIIDRRYEGGVVAMIGHESVIDSEEVVLTTILTV